MSYLILTVQSRSIVSFPMYACSRIKRLANFVAAYWFCASIVHLWVTSPLWVIVAL